MDRTLVHLESGQLDDIISIGVDGSVDVDTEALARVLSKQLSVLGVRVAVSQCGLPAARGRDARVRHPDSERHLVAPEG